MYQNGVKDYSYHVSQNIAVTISHFTVNIQSIKSIIVNKFTSYYIPNLLPISYPPCSSKIFTVKDITEL